MVEQVELNRLFWHSRRGMLELDVLLVPFVQEVYPHLNQVDRDLYVRLLTCEDRTCSAGSWSAANPKTRNCSAWSG